MFSSTFSLVQKLFSFWIYKWAPFSCSKNQRGYYLGKTYPFKFVNTYNSYVCIFYQQNMDWKVFPFFSCQRLESMTFHFRTKSLTAAGGWRPCWVSRSQISWPFSKDFWLQRIYITLVGFVKWLLRTFKLFSNKSSRYSTKVCNW